MARGMSYRFDMRKLAIRAVHGQAPGELLNRLGLSELMMKGELTYGICESIVNLDNLPRHELALKVCYDQFTIMLYVHFKNREGNYEN